MILWIIIFLFVFKIYQKVTCGFCKTDAKLIGKTAIVTGANTGLGFETAKDLARRGARVILACRNEKRGLDARKKIIEETENTNVIFKKLDLSSLDSVRSFAEDVLKTESQLNILVNNAGAGVLGNRKTKDGIVVEMQINYFGPFLLTNLLIPLLKASAPSRIINISSLAHWFGKIDFNLLNKENHYYDFKLYSICKLCNLLMTNELSRKLRGTGVVANSLHPGLVYTKIFRNTPEPAKTIINFLYWSLFKNIWEGTQTIIHVAVAPELAHVTGKYFADCKEAMQSFEARDEHLAKKLWEFSERLVELKEEYKIRHHL